MRQLDVSMTLAEAVDGFPQLAREFEKRGLDYCCGGGRTIKESCALIGLDPSATVAEMSALSTVAIAWSLAAFD